MAEFLLNRRYCRFKDRKSKRSTMSNEEEADFKLKRFIQDVDKYVEKTKKRQARKEAKIKEQNSNIVGTKGIFKPAVLGHSALKALLNGSTVARLKGDLIDLSTKNKSNQENSGNSTSLQTSKNKSSTQKQIENDSLNNNINKSIPENEENNHLSELETEPVEKKNSEPVAEAICSEKGDTPNNSVRDQEASEIRNEGGFFVENDDAIGITEHLRSFSPSENSRQLDVEPPEMMENFFDLLNKTPEKNKSPAFDFPNNSINNPKLDKYHQNDEINSSDIGHDQTLQTELVFPKDYISKFKSTNNKSIKQFELVKNDKKNCDKTSFTLFNDYVNPNLHLSKPKNFLDKADYWIPSESSDKSLEDPSSLFKCGLSGFDKFQPRKDFQVIGNNELRKNRFYFNPLCVLRESNSTNFLENLNFNKKLIEKDQFYQRKRVKYKNKLLSSSKHSLLSSNSRFKNNLKFSPHKYC